mmetsp:Transcript_12844/g.19887  ORF Transcript_12844/g.19887 Transcript_12844/m.19887 type:complete len:865 (+) Transcript_12844:220-2814(+)
MFMQSFENTNKQQQRRQQRQLALQRMEEAANVALSTANNTEDVDDDVENLNNGDTIDTSANHYVDENINEQRDHPWNRKSTEKKTSNTLTSAANFLRESQDSYSFEPATTTAAKQFLWDDQSAYSNGTNHSSKVNLQNIKNLNKKSDTAGKGARWNAINSVGAGGLWNALPVWGGGQQVDASASVASGGSSRYRDVEGERLITLANERVKIDNMSALDKECGHVDNDAVAEEDYDSLLRRRVFLNKDGTITHDGTDESLSSRRMRNTCFRKMKRPTVLICAVGIAIAIVSGTMTMYNKFMTNDDSSGATVPTFEEESENDSNFEVVEIPPPSVEVDEIGFTELEVDGVKIDIDKERLEQIKAVILDSQVSTPTAIQDTTSAQFAALLWLVREDPRHLDPDNANLLQRYGLAVLWFSTTKNKYYHVSGEYTSVENDNGRHLSISDIDKWFHHDSWLSELGVCGWSGITCSTQDNGLDHVGNNDDGDVTSIDLRRNNLRGAFPSDVFRALPFLKALDLSDNALAGTISKDIGQLSGLEYFNFTANNIAGSLPDSIGDMALLKVFHMSFNQLDHTIPYSIYKLEKLRDLDLSRNSLAATIPHEIGAMKELISLNLAYNSLEGSLPHELNNMQSLVKLDVSYNKLQSSLPNEIGAVTYLRSLNLSHNQFAGDLPKSIGNLEHLDELHLNDNDFKGIIPTELSKLDALDVLNLSNNHFSGIFPIWLTHLFGLKELDISNNAIKGEIPQSIADMKNLRILNFARNDIIGIIPTEMGSLFKLEQIFLETNELIGGVPYQLGELTSLRKLSLHNNFLTGHVSDHLCKLSNEMFLTQFTVDCAGETAVILCECCQCHLHENIIHLDENNRYED